MAIFRGGKRIGPFDIRMGFPRDRSMQNIDGDTRLKQRANTENTIGRFRANMAKSAGYARQARYAVRIFPPASVAKLAGESKVEGFTGTTTKPGESGGAKPVMSNPTHYAMHQLYKSMGEQLNMNCDSVTMPGHDMQTETIDHFGPTREMAVGHGFAGTITCSFYADKYLRERSYLEYWQKLVVDNMTHKAGYYDDYVGKMQIFQLGSLDGQGDRDIPTYAIEATEVYPEQIGPITYNYGASNQITKVNVEFQYRQWLNMTLDGVGAMNYGKTYSETPLHEIQGRTGLAGVVDRLPPELQRAGRNVINQAKTQLPTGRIFKGKVFPPFF